MAGNANLGAAKAARNDEFYTQWGDIESEMQAYLEYDPDVFRGKTVLLPCDDPGASNFTKYFALNFEKFGLKKLISTSYAPASNPAVTEKGQKRMGLALGEDDNRHRGRIYVLEQGTDLNEDGKLNKEDIQWDYLEGDGDFRSEEVTALRDEADMVVTNPPFSLFREFMAWLVEGDVRFSVIGNMNAITYKEIFPLIRDNKVWVGASGMTSMMYQVPDTGELKGTQYRTGDGTRYQKLGNTCWFTNIPHGRRYEKLQLITKGDNLMYSRRKKVREQGYPAYGNYDAIEVAFTEAIPSDYDNAMGVPISFLGKYNPEQFEILGISEQNLKGGSGDLWDQTSGVKHPLVGGDRIYARIFIRHVRK